MSWEALTAGREVICGPVALSIGVFDGVHLGHRALIELIRGYRRDMAACVLTFRENPARRLRPRAYHGDVVSFRQRLEKLERLGVAVAVVVEFSEEFQRLRGEQFIERLCENMTLRYLAVGRNFRCGYEMQMTARDVRRYLAPRGVRVDIATPVVDNELKLPVSSTTIRRAVLDGELERVRLLLGSEFEVDLADLPLQRHSTGCRVRKYDCSQVLPQSGMFEVELLGEGTPLRDTLEIAEDHIQWTRNCDTTNRIRFLRQLRTDEK